MVCDPIVDIPEFDCGSNVGGNLRLWAVPVSEVTAIPAATGSTILTDITLDVLSPGWRTLGHIGETANWKATRQGELDNGSYMYTATFNCAKLDDARLTALKLLEGKNLLLLVEDSNETVTLLGDLKRPMKVSKCDFDTGTKATDTPMFVVEFKGKFPFAKLPNIYEGVI